MKKRFSVKYLLTPDYMFERYGDITPEFLSSLGIKAVLVDIDNTLAPYEQPEPDEEIIAWFSALSEIGIRASLISNNGRERVELFNRSLALDAYPDSKKPSGKVLTLAMSKMESDATNTAVIGDQLLTDALAAHRLGLLALIVPPIKDKTSLFFKFKRWLERPYIKRYNKLHGKEVK
ncbi:MAG: YqeG family HAD IIIA-type phosphatase [Clostridia bacterium]|nr:YqeG family HAD IIIA-type phosphatase [Clostridia bacterium]